MTIRGNLNPTRVLRKDGHMTTVHKKTDITSPSLGKLAGIQPKLAPASKKGASFEAKQVTVKWDVDFSGGDDHYRGKSHLAAHMGSLISRMGVNVSRLGKSGSVKISQGEMYEYLREGISLPQAAALQSQDPSPENWIKKGIQNDILPGSLSFAQYGANARRVEIKNAVDALREHEVSPHVAQRMLKNGFNDAHLGGVLDLDQKVRLFERFKYQASTNENVETNAAATLNALLDGRLPFELFEKDYTRSSLTSALDAIYPKKRQGASSRDQNSLTEDEREHLRKNPHEIVDVVAAMNGPESQSVSFRAAYDSVSKFGLEESLKYSPLLLLTKREDGSLVGVEGARIARDFVDYCKEKFSDTITAVSDSPFGSMKVFDRNSGVYEKEEASYVDIISMREAGASRDTIIDLIHKQRLSGSQALAVVKGQTTASIGKGWL